MSIKKHIPNTITCCNLVSGCIATSFAFGGNPRMALLWIIIGAVFDFFDGMSARLLHVSSPIGKELDSLADDVTFGVAPATIRILTTLCDGISGFSGAFAPMAALRSFIIAASRHCDWLSLILMSARLPLSSVFLHQPTPCSGVR